MSDTKRSPFRDEELRRLHELKEAPASIPIGDCGVLLSDRIKHYCIDYQLVTPFDNDNLRPAGYDLTVGPNYAIRGEEKTLNDGGILEIPPYEVAVIQTRETLNLPKFLIGRWNIRVGLAYRGLLWVGGAQVDPGFRGRLSCPIYNLSTESVSLKYGDPLAMIDFVTTTPYREFESLAFPWERRRAIVFQEYNTSLKSGVAEQIRDIDSRFAQERINTEGQLRSTQTRIDNFVSLVFTVVSLLFAGLSIVATKGSGEVISVLAPICIAMVALYFALRAYGIVPNLNGSKKDRGSIQRMQDKSEPEPWHIGAKQLVLELSIGGLIVIASLILYVFHAYASARDIERDKASAKQRTETLLHKNDQLERDILQLHTETNAKLNALQHEIDSVLQTAQKSH